MHEAGCTKAGWRDEMKTSVGSIFQGRLHSSKDKIAKSTRHPRGAMGIINL
jgi:hypothetical protein